MESGVLEGGTGLRSVPSRIAVFGLFGIENFGNDGSMEAMRHFLKRECPDAQLTVICPQPEVVERTYSVSALRTNLLGPSGWLFWLLDRLLLRVPRMVDLLMRTISNARKIDLLVVPGTGILEEPSHRLTRMHWTLLLWCAAAKVTGKKIAFVSVGAAPINSAAARLVLKTALGMAHYRSFRDESSRRCAKEFYGVKVEGDPVYPDIVFGLPEPGGLARVTPKDGHSLSVGLGPMGLWWWYGDEVQKSYVDKLVDFSLSLVRKGYRIRLLVGDKADYGTVDDFIRAILDKDPSLLGDSIIAEYIVCAQDLMRQIALTDLVICSRFHNIVYALKQGKPVVSLGYSPKHRALMEEVGLGEFIQAAHQIDVPLLEKQFLALLKDRKTYEQSIQQAIARFQELRGQQEQILSTRFLGSGMVRELCGQRHGMEVIA